MKKLLNVRLGTNTMVNQFTKEKMKMYQEFIIEADAKGPKVDVDDIGYDFNNFGIISGGKA